MTVSVCSKVVLGRDVPACMSQTHGSPGNEPTACRFTSLCNDDEDGVKKNECCMMLYFSPHTRYSRSNTTAGNSMPRNFNGREKRGPESPWFLLQAHSGGGISQKWNLS